MRAFLCILAVVAVTQACVREGPRDGERDEDHDKKKPMKEEMHRVLFGLYDGFPGFSYMDKETGMNTGMTKEIIDRTCAACNVQCDTVFIGDNLGRCFNPETITGEGLMNYHYHACFGWAPTVTRANVFNFTSEVMHTPKAAVYAKPGTDITDMEAMMAASIGFRKYWYLDPMCLRKHMMENDGSILPDENVKIVDAGSWEELKMGVDNDEYQFVYMPAGHPASEGMMMIGEPMTCSMGGFSLMHRKDIDFEWFETCGWMMLKSPENDPMGKHGVYRRMCQKWGLDDLCFTDEEMDMGYMKQMKKMEEKEMKEGHMH